MNSGDIENKNIESAKDLIEFKKYFDESNKSIMRNLVKEEIGAEIKDLINESRLNEADEEEKDITSDTDVMVDDEKSGDEFDADTSDNADDSETESETETDIVVDDSDDTESDFSEFEKYKVDDDTYDLRSDVNGEDAVKIFKLLKDDDQIVTVKQDGDNINIKDNENGSEYMIVTNNNDSVEEPADDTFSEFDMDSEFDLNESKLASILKEIDLGYTTKYQEKTAMSTDGVAEPGKDVKTWDKGAPTSGDETRRYGKRGDDNPFDETVTEEFDMDLEEEVEAEEANVEEGGLTRTKRELRQHASVKSEPQIKYTQGKRVDQVRDGAQLVTSKMEESKKLKESKAKYEKLLKEYIDLKDLVVSLSGTLKESMLNQTKLAKFVKLVTENTTSNKEKIEIINRFDKEVKTKEDADRLYESINKSLKNNTKNLNESVVDTKTVLGDSKSAGETVLYENKEINDIKNLMKRIEKK